MNEVILELKDLNFSNYDKVVFDNVNVELRRDTLTCVLAESGGGSSSLLKIMAGLILPTSGKVLFKNKEIHSINKKLLFSLRKQFSFVFQNSALISNLSIGENVMLPLNFHFPKMRSKEKKAKTEEALGLAGIADQFNMRPAQISQGKQKMAAIVRALITKPEMVFFDEPFGGLDPTMRRSAEKIIIEYSDLPETTVVLSTYSKYMILNKSDKILYIENGSVTTFERENHEENYDPEVVSKRLIKDIIFS